MNLSSAVMFVSLFWALETTMGKMYAEDGTDLPYAKVAKNAELAKALNKKLLSSWEYNSKNGSDIGGKQALKRAWLQWRKDNRHNMKKSRQHQSNERLEHQLRASSHQDAASQESFKQLDAYVRRKLYLQYFFNKIIQLQMHRHLCHLVDQSETRESLKCNDRTAAQSAHSLRQFIEKKSKLGILKDLVKTTEEPYPKQSQSLWVNSKSDSLMKRLTQEAECCSDLTSTNGGSGMAVSFVIFVVAAALHLYQILTQKRYRLR